MLERLESRPCIWRAEILMNLETRVLLIIQSETVKTTQHMFLEIIFCYILKYFAIYSNIGDKQEVVKAAKVTSELAKIIMKMITGDFNWR